jgi:uncharacterized protein (TIGR00288 family)
VNANLALLIDFENIATGCEKEGLGRFDVRVVMRRFKDKGRILVARAYADWGRWNRFKQDLTTEGVAMFELSHHGMQAKNRADIALVVDAMELVFTRDFLDTYIIMSGDSDFTPLVMRLKELNKRVIGCGTRGSTSSLIADLCDEFIFYDTIRAQARPAEPDPEDAGSLTRDEAVELLLETIENLQRDEPGPVHSSVVKTTMKRKAPTFSETDLGFRSFTRFVEVAAEKGLVVLSPDQKAGGYLVDLPGSTNDRPGGPPPPSMDAQKIGHILSEQGIEVGTVADRTLILGEFVAACAEREQKNRKCAVEYVTGDLIRRIKQGRVSIPTRVVRGVVIGLARSGALVHPDGAPVRTPTAQFVPPTDAAELLRTLDGLVANALRAKGVEAGTPGVAEVLSDVGRLAEEAGPAPLAPLQAEQEQPEHTAEAPRPRRRRRTAAETAEEAALALAANEGEPGVPDEPTEESAADAAAEAAAGGAPTEGTGSAPRRRRRRRTKKAE